MDKTKSNISHAKSALKAHIKFCEKLIKHLNGDNQEDQIRATLIAWCIDAYMSKYLKSDLSYAIKEAMEMAKNMESNNKDE